MSQERRDHMTETFVAVHDALQRAVVPTVGVELKRLPDLPRPWYLPSPASAEMSGEMLEAQIRLLASTHPEYVVVT